MAEETLHAALNEILASAKVETVAKAIGTSKSYVTMIKKGKEIPTDVTLAALARKYAPDRLPELLCRAAWARAQRQEHRPEDQQKPQKLGKEQKPPPKPKKVDPEAMELLKKTLKAMAEYPPPVPPLAITHPRTLRDFPHGFYPLTIITGDKREHQPDRLTAGDLGVVSATPADTRWVLGLGLGPSVTMHVDRGLHSYTAEQLISRYAETNLLVVGGPATNHLTRRINRTALFQFNHNRNVDQHIDEAIDKAKALRDAQDFDGLRKHLTASHEDLTGQIVALFEGGVFSPLYGNSHVVRPSDVANPVPTLGIVTFAENPWYAEKRLGEGQPNDHKYVSIIVAGIRHEDTACALRCLTRDEKREGTFVRRPFGGVIEVASNQQMPFSEQIENARWTWREDGQDDQTDVAKYRRAMLDCFEKIEEALTKGELSHLQLTAEEARKCHDLLEAL